MSKNEIDGQQILPPQEQLFAFYMHTGRKATPLEIETVTKKAELLGLPYSREELAILGALSTPDKVQEFLNTELYYNHDHGAEAARSETAMSPKMVLEAGYAHCFEAALFAYTVNYLHGHDPKLVILEASEDYDHNLVVYKNKDGLWGANAHSRYHKLDGREATFSSLHELARDYLPHYYDGPVTNITLVGYSEPIDLSEQFGTTWMGAKADLWDIYFGYVQKNTKFHYLDNFATPHTYPMLQAIKEGWITVEDDGKVSVQPNNLTPEARTLWNQFFATYKSQEHESQETSRAIALNFFNLTGIRPLDLETNKGELESLLSHGYTVDYLMRSAQ